MTSTQLYPYHMIRLRRTCLSNRARPGKDRKEMTLAICRPCFIKNFRVLLLIVLAFRYFKFYTVARKSSIEISRKIPEICNISIWVYSATNITESGRGRLLQIIIFFELNYLRHCFPLHSKQISSGRTPQTKM